MILKYRPICFVFANIFKHEKQENTHNRRAHSVDYIKNTNTTHWGAQGCVYACVLACAQEGEGQISQVV